MHTNIQAECRCSVCLDTSCACGCPMHNVQNTSECETHAHREITATRRGYRTIRQVLPLLSVVGLTFLTSCMSVPSSLDLSLDRPTMLDKYHIAIHPLADPIVINRMHAWEIQLRTSSGQPVSDAQISVGGGMPQHSHGFPTQPRVTKDLGNGRYLLEGMKFSMPGWWEIKLKVDAESGTDEVTFNTIIASPAVYGAATNNAVLR